MRLNGRLKFQMAIGNVHGLWLLLFPYLLSYSHMLAAEPSSCPTQCICVENRMNCEKPGLKRLPPPFRLHLETLHVANQTFDNPRLGPVELAAYASPEYGGQVILKKLFIRFCNINAIERRAFRALGSTLEMVDLTGNPLMHVGAHAFAGLGPLTLVLDYIEQPEFDSMAFEDCRLKSLMMQYSNLTSLPVQPLLSLASKGRLDKLLLRGNRFRHLDSQYQSLFSELSYFELDENPWHCDCQLTWLIRRYRQMLESRLRNARDRGPHSEVSPEINQPRCASPTSLISRKFTDLITDLREVYSSPNTATRRRLHPPPTIMHCPPPQIERLDINLEQFYMDPFVEAREEKAHVRELHRPAAHLRCAVRGSPQLSVVWRYHHPGMGPTNLPNTNVTQRNGNGRMGGISATNTFEPWLDDAHETETALRVEKSGELDIYSCLGQDAIGNVSALVRIQWPPENFHPSYPTITAQPGLVSNDNGVRQNSANQTHDSAISSDWSTQVLMSSQSALHTPQFSLSQLLGAIAGTFLSTILLFFIVHWTLHCRMADQVRQKRYHGEKAPTNGTEALGVSPVGTSSSHTSSSNTKLISAHKLNETPTNCCAGTVPVQMNPDTRSLSTNLFNAHAYHQLMNGELPGMGNQTLPVGMGHGATLLIDQANNKTSPHEDGNNSQTAAYEPVTYSDTKPFNYDIPWMVSLQTSQATRPSNDQHIPLLLSGMLTDVNRYAETPISSHPGLIQSALMIPPPPPIPQPSLPSSAQSSLTMINAKSTRNPSMTPKDSNLFALQASGYPYPGLVSNPGLFDTPTNSS